MQWGEKEQIHLLNAIPTYRRAIQNKSIKEAIQFTLELANLKKQRNKGVTSI